MSQRIQRVNELILREVSEQLRTRYRSEAVAITITDVETSTDLRNARIYYSVIGDEEVRNEASALFRKVGRDLHQKVSQRVILKYFPKFEFQYDPSLERGAGILDILDQLGEEENHSNEETDK